jgi:deazaflavin-dependent oxidoreductase (nitroreductase family)
LANWNWFGKLHTSLYKATGGLVGGNLVGLPMLLLTTTGRKTGMPRTSPMPYLGDGEDWVIVGSNNGGPRDPAWWFNLQADPRAELQMGRTKFQATARLASPQERTRLWPMLLTFNRQYAKYEKQTTREIPVVVLSRAS